eukprot:6182769-Pleurochrysis_carterae.AAC.3
MTPPAALVTAQEKTPLPTSLCVLFCLCAVCPFYVRCVNPALIVSSFRVGLRVNVQTPCGLVAAVESDVRFRVYIKCIGFVALPRFLAHTLVSLFHDPTRLARATICSLSHRGVLHQCVCDLMIGV